MALDDREGFRINSDAKQTFTDTCRKYNREPHEVLREIIDAFNENRLRILIPKNQPKQLEIYQHVNRK